MESHIHSTDIAADLNSDSQNMSTYSGLKKLSTHENLTFTRWEPYMPSNKEEMTTPQNEPNSISINASESF